MKLAVVLVTILAAVAARPGPEDAQITRYESDNIGVDGYRFAFDTSDGTSRQEQAQIRNPGTDYEALAVQGSYSWYAPDGQRYEITFIADENGFQPQGAHLPRA